MAKIRTRTLSSKKSSELTINTMRHRSLVRKCGANYIELAQETVIRSMVAEATIRRQPQKHIVGPTTKLFAKILKKSDIEFISRYGRDLLGE